MTCVSSFDISRVLTVIGFDGGQGRNHKHQQNGQQDAFVSVGWFVLEAGMTAATQLTERAEFVEEERQSI